MTTADSKAVFLDRDGIINVEHDYVHRIEDFTFLDGIFDFCRTAARKRFQLVVATNQAGIARGYYTEEDFERLTSWMIDAFAREGITMAKVYGCPFHPDASIERYRADSFDRKPNPGMLLRARDELSLDLAASVLVGDRLTDIEAGRRAGVGRLCLLASPRADLNDPSLRDVLVCRSLDEAAARLFGQIS
jgi:D-glycero-D-manno-heptose 1,7-bisphosphate phosphatase